MSFLGLKREKPIPITHMTLEERKAALISGGTAVSEGASYRGRSRGGALVPILLFFMIVLLFFGSSSKNTAQGKTKQENVAQDSTVSTITPLFPDYSSLEAITQNSDVILRGVVKSRGTSKWLTVKNEKGEDTETLFTPVLIEVVTAIKGEPGEELGYLELGGVDGNRIVDVENVPALAIDSEIFLFCNKDGTGFGNWSVFYVSNGSVTLEKSRLPSGYSVISEKKSDTTTLSAEDFIDMIKAVVARQQKADTR